MRGDARRRRIAPPHPTYPHPPTPPHMRSVMRDANINVIMISQASSEHSVCFAVKAGDTVKAKAALDKR